MGVLICSAPHQSQHTGHTPVYWRIFPSNIQTNRSTDVTPIMKAEVPSPRPPCPYVMIPVPKEDFKKVNDLAEAYWIASDPENKKSIKELRRNLLRKHNKEVIEALMERERETKQENK